MNRLMKVGLRITVGLIITLAVTPLLVRAGNASQGGGVIVANPRITDFGGVTERVQQVTRLIEIRNDGTSDLVVSDLSLIGQDVEDFSFSAQWPFTLAPADRRQIIVTFNPFSQGPKEVVLRIGSDASNERQLDVQLKGTGLPVTGLGHIIATAIPSNNAPHPGAIITVSVKVNMSGANPPADRLANYQASLSYDPDVLLFNGFTLGDSPWFAPSAISGGNGSVQWQDYAFNGAGGNFTVLRLKFKVIGNPGSRTNLGLFFPRAEGTGVEDLTKILGASGSEVQVEGETTPPDIDVNPPSYSFGAVPIRSTSSKKFLLSNTGMQDLIVNSISLGGTSATQFKIVDGAGGFTIPPGQNREVEVSFTPTSMGSKSASLLIRSNDPDEKIFLVNLSGNVAAPNIVVTPKSLSFGDAFLGTSVSKTLQVRNTGTAILQLTLIGLDGNQNQFAYSTNYFPFVLPGGSVNITVFFRPSTEGAKNATLVISSNDPDKPVVSVPLSGNGVRRPAIRAK